MVPTLKDASGLHTLSRPISPFAGPKEEAIFKRVIFFFFFFFFFLRCHISLGLLPFSFCTPFIPSCLTTHEVHERCSQQSHLLGVRSGLGIKKWISTLLSLARTYQKGCTPHLLGPRPPLSVTSLGQESGLASPTLLMGTPVPCD